jgi:predicted transcriptional regulator
MGFVLTKIRSNLIRVVAIAGLILFACFRLYGWYFSVPWDRVFIENQKEDWRTLTSDIVSMSQSGDGMIFFPYNVAISVETYLRNFPLSDLETIPMTDEYYSLGGNTKVLPYPDKDRLEYSLQYQRVWLIEGAVDTHIELNQMQKEAIKRFLEDNYIQVGHQEYFDVRWTLYQKKASLPNSDL